jgi:RNA polymerase sigma-70 factor (ECF subfamily)
MTEAERTLIAGCLRGDKDAWDTFVRQFSSLVYSTIYKTLALHHAVQRDQGVVEDLFQEFFVAMFTSDCRKLRQFRGDRGCTMASWLRVVAARLTVDYLRRQRPGDVEVTEAIAADQPDPPSALITLEEERLLAKAMQSLSDRDRLVIELTYRRSLGAEEIAALLKTSVGAVYTQKSRVLDKLREILGKTLSL